MSLFQRYNLVRTLERFFFELTSLDRFFRLLNVALFEMYCHDFAQYVSTKGDRLSSSGSDRYLMSALRCLLDKSTERN